MSKDVNIQVSIDSTPLEMSLLKTQVQILELQIEQLKVALELRVQDAYEDAARIALICTAQDVFSDSYVCGWHDGIEQYTEAIRARAKEMSK